jgi:hypothetical protein
MGKLKHILEVAVTGMLVVCSSASVRAQSQPQGTDAGRISETVRSISYPKGMIGNEVMVDWDRGYVIHYEIGQNYSPDTPMAEMFDKTGKQVRQGRIWPQGAGSVAIRRTAATRDGAILAGGWANSEGRFHSWLHRQDGPRRKHRAVRANRLLQASANL